MSSPKTHILVGGSGFIGSYLAEELVQRGKEVISIGRTETAHLPGITSLVLDVADPISLQKKFPQGELVYILIGQNHAQFNTEEELQILKQLIAILNQRCPQEVIYLSSALVYGETMQPATEGDQCHPIDQYSQFKLLAEKLLQETVDPRIRLGILRLTNVYGGKKNRGFIGLIMDRLNGTNPEPLTLNGDGLQERDYVFIDDVVQAILTVSNRLEKNDIVNIATGKSETLLGLLKRVATLAGTSCPFRLGGKTLIEVKQSRVSNEKLKNVYQYIPEVTLTMGLKKTLKRYQEKATKSKAKSYGGGGKKLLLIGGEGFVGRNLAHYFFQQYDCYSIGRSRSTFPERGDQFIQLNPYRETIPGEYDIVIHLIDNKIAPKQIAEQEKKLLKHLTLKPGAHLIVLSSAVVYANPDSDYGQRKRHLESFYQQHCLEQGISLTIFRPFNLFGPFQLPYRQGSLIANLMCNFLAGRDTVINDMEARRDFVYAPDIAKFVEHVLTEQKQGTFDIGSGKLTRVRDVIECLNKNVFKKRAGIVDRRVHESIPEQPATQVLLTLIPMVDFDEGLKQTFRFYQKYFHFF